MTRQPVEIVCTVCGADTLLRREPVYDGFKKIGEELLCAACGHAFESEETVPFKQRSQGPSIFSDADRPRNVDVFAGDEKGRLCRYCKNYVVNPFTQRCSLHNRVVEATDTCPDFEKQEEPEEEESEASDL